MMQFLKLCLRESFPQGAGLRLIAKVYLDDPLTCPKCKGQMKIIAFIEEDSVIAKILKYVGLWERPALHAPPILEFVEHTQGCDKEHSPLLPPEARIRSLLSDFY